MAIIKTPDGDVFVDDDDYTYLKDKRVRILVSNRHKATPYRAAVFWDSTISTRKYTILARFLLDAPDDMEVDHINRDSLDNRRENLRLCTRSQNTVNRPGRQGANEWGYRGIVKYKASKKTPTSPDNYYWRAAVGSGKSKVHAGSHKSPHVAALKYNMAALRTYGEHVLLNVVDCFSGETLPRVNNCSTCNAVCFCCCACA